MIYRCISCKPHEFQDERYGKNMRVMNNCFLNKQPAYRCTVCGTKYPVGNIVKIGDVK